MKDKFSARSAKRSFRCFCVALAAFILCGTLAFSQERASAVAQTTQSLTELQEQLKRIEKELKENEKKLSRISKEKNDQKKVVNNAYSRIESLNKQIDLLSSRIELLNADIRNTNSQITAITAQIRSLNDQISTTQAAIAKKQADLEYTYALLQKRVRAMYMAGVGSGLGSTVELLMNVKDYSTLLNLSELLVRVAKNDNDLMELIKSDIGELQTLETSLNDSLRQVESKKAELESKKTALSNTKKELQASNAQLVAKQKELTQQYDNAQKTLNSLNKESAEYTALIRQQEKEIDRANRQIAEELRKNGSKTTDKNGEASSAKMIFPLKCSGVRITSAFGYRIHPTRGTPSYHKGTDFSAPNIYQKPIYAVRDGYVFKLVNNDYWYGNYVVIDHGDGVSSMYAHCDSTCVKQGAKVTQGQVIGCVGSTGQSTGAHLHFGVLVNGRYVDPMKGYLTLP